MSTGTMSRIEGPGDVDKLQRCFGGVRLLDGIGASLKNVERLDMGAMPMVHRMAQRGLQVDLSHFERLHKDLVQDMDRCTAEVHRLTGHWINPGSGDQVAELLFKKMGLKQAKQKFTASGDRESVEDEVLKAIQHEHPVIGVLQDYKEFEKLDGTYVLPMPKLARKTAFGVWRMFPNFRVTRVPTGRFATADPNLLAMPTRTERGRDIRKGFITDSGWVMVSVDESQIEPRLAAHRSKDPNLCNIYRNGEDIYSDFAISAFRLPDKRYQDSGKWKYPGVDKQDHRTPSKTCVLASIYSVTAVGLQEQLPTICGNCNKPTRCTKCDKREDHTIPDDCPVHKCIKFRPLWTEDKAQKLIDAFYLRYSGLMKMQISDHQYMRKTATVVDMWGRLLHVQAVRSVLPWVVNSTLREGSNFPIQSSAAGTLKLAMAAVDWDLDTAGWYGDVCHALLPIHDELLFECRQEYAEELGNLVKYRFETCCQLDVPIGASAVTAPNWGDLPK